MSESLPLQAVRGWHGVTLRELAEQLGISPNSGWANDKRVFDQSNLRPNISDPPIIQRLLNAIRWDLEGGGPINDIGYDNQVKKRMIQDRLNRRLAMLLVRNDNIHGKVLSLSGTKLHQGAYPFITMGLASQVIVIEKKKQNYLIISDILQKDLQVCKNIFLGGKQPMDIREAVKKVMNSKTHNQEFTGFDLDFDTSLTDETLNCVKNIIDNTISPMYWLRLAVTVRPMGIEKTLEQLNHIPTYVISNNRYSIIDIAAGPVFTYFDTSTMAVFQLIATRRKEQ